MFEVADAAVLEAEVAAPAPIVVEDETTIEERFGDVEDTGFAPDAEYGEYTESEDATKYVEDGEEEMVTIMEATETTAPDVQIVDVEEGSSQDASAFFKAEERERKIASGEIKGEYVYVFFCFLSSFVRSLVRRGVQCCADGRVRFLFISLSQHLLCSEIKAFANVRIDD